MKRSVFFLLASFLSLSLYAQNKFDVLPYWKMYQARTPLTYHLLMGRAMEQLEARNSKVEKIKNEREWEAYRKDLLRQVKNSLGPFPQRTPLNATVSSTAESGGIAVENILFESLPGYFVSASFFKRKDAGGKLPVIVFCSGHSPSGYRGESYQQMILNYAQKGFAVFAFDPVGQGERIQYRKADGKAALGPTHDHSYSGSRAFLLGDSPAKYFIWDGVRAIDYLETRPDVDMGRIGIAGRSGGGTQSSYIAALDERVAAAAPECYITTYEMLLKSKGPQDAEQIFLGGIANGIDIPDLLHLRAPKPTLVVTTTNDIFSIQGNYDLKKEVSALYNLTGKGDHFQMVEDYAGHASTKLNREACYRFFSKFLSNPCDTIDQNVVFFEERQLYASPKGDVFQISGSKRLDEIIAESGNRIKAAVDKDKKAPLSSGVLSEILNYKPEESPSSSIYSGSLLSEEYRVDKYLVRAPEGNYLPTLVIGREKNNAEEGTIALYLNEGGKSADTTRILGLLEKFTHVVCADLSGIGELKEYYNWQGDAYIDGTPLNLWYLALLTNQTLVQYRLAEIDALYRFIGAKLPASGVVGLAEGAVTTDLLHWGFLHREKLEKLILVNPILSFGTLMSPGAYQPAFLLRTAGGMLKHYDLPDLFSRFPAESLRLVNPVDGNGKPLDKAGAVGDKRIPMKSLVFVEDVRDGI